MKIKKLKYSRKEVKNLKLIMYPLLFLIVLSYGQIIANFLGMQFLEIALEPPITVGSIIGIFLACWLIITFIHLIALFFPWDKIIEWAD